YADVLIDVSKFAVSKFAVIFGPNHLAYNIRLFSYLFNFVKLYGCLDRFSCLPYESELGHLKDYIHGPKPPAVQPCRRLVERFGLDAVEEGIFLDDVGLPLRPSATCGCHRFPHKGVIFSKNFPDNRILLDETFADALSVQQEALASGYTFSAEQHEEGLLRGAKCKQYVHHSYYDGCSKKKRLASDFTNESETGYSADTTSLASVVINPPAPKRPDATTEKFPNTNLRQTKGTVHRWLENERHKVRKRLQRATDIDK
ncbi:hypothetical protein CLF_111970, partial [Clonorchis sinensis]